jgi:hypothetical protein
MQPPITLTFRHVERSGALENRARKLGSRLGLFGQNVLRCHMTLEGPGKRSDGARAPYLVRIDLTVPNAQIHADSLGVDGVGHEDIFLALRDAFENARRQLQDLHRKSWRRIETG